MTVHPFSHVQINLSPGTILEASLSVPPSLVTNTSRDVENKLAVCLHPWSWMGGRMDDPVLHSLKEPFLERGYHVLRYNSRGVGRSSGWPSPTGSREAQDLQDLVQWALTTIPSVTSVVILGYSYGSLIASLFPLLPDPIKVSHILLSYPLGPRSWLTAFRGKTFTSALNDLLHEARANVLVIYGDHDEFTSAEKYEGWVEGLKNEVLGGGRGKLDVVKIEDATHMWTDQNGAGSKMLRTIKDWVP